MHQLPTLFNVKNLRKSLRALLNTSTCKHTGFIYQTMGSDRVFLKNRNDYLSPKRVSQLCQNYYYKHYLPAAGETVVCIGAGLGHEAIWLKHQQPMVRYVGIEIQPSIYELLCNTFKNHVAFQAFGNAIATESQPLMLHSAANYTAVDSSELGYIAVNTIPWQAFLEKHAIKTIDLLQINIEGGEKMLLPAIGDFSMVKRVIISAHDFRADRGDGEQYRTRAFVKAFLTAQGFSIKHCGDKPRQMDWMFGERI